MSIFDQLGGLLNNYVNGQGAQSRQEARDHYDQIYPNVPQDTLGSIIGPALASLGTQQVRERVYNSATEMNPQERGDFLQTLLSGFLNSGVSLPGLLGQLGVNQEVTRNPALASPDDIAKLTTYAQETNPSVFHQAMRFFASHPELTKVLGRMAMSAIIGRLAQRGRGATP
jgi:hypothetical protein